MKHHNSTLFLADVLAQCKSTPDNVCIIDERKSTYSDFLDQIERTSGYLKDKRVPKGSFVLVNLPNSMEYIAAEFGVWAYGCAVIPVSPAYPRERTEYIKQHSEAVLEIDADAIKQIRKSARLEIFEPTDGIAALFYTSGSTGKPKGVVHTFETLAREEDFDALMHPAESDCFASGAPMSFIASAMLIPNLRAGGSVRLLSRETMTSATLLQQALEEDGITGVFLNPSALRQIDLDRTTLRYVLTGSERVVNIGPRQGLQIFNVYGMTETLGPVLAFEIDKAYGNTPVGKPFKDIEVRLEEDGEICLRGPMSAGYFKDPERSAELWRGGWLHTGDIGKMLPDGNIEYVNRKDWMVKINGQRVEIGESLSVMKAMEGIEDAIVKGFTATDGHQYLVGYYVSAAGLSPEEIIRQLSKQLADYMIPKLYVRLDVLPRTSNGKVDMQALQSPLDLDQERQIEKPQTPEQERICSAFQTALGISPIGIDDDFFSMGGDSIRVMQLQTLLADLNLSTDTIYRHRTPRNLAQASLGQTPLKLDRPADGIYPLSKSQTGIFIECMNRRGEAIYNNPLLYKLSKKLDAEKLALSCVAALKAHPGLFAKILTDENGLPRQKAQSSEGFEIKVEQISDRQLQTLRPTLVQPFDILSDRLFRIRVFKSESAVWLFTDFHHIVYDGTSNGIILSDIEKAYGGLAPETESFTAFDIALEEEYRRATPDLEESRKWYLENYSDIDSTSLPSPDIFSDTQSFTRLEIPTGIPESDFQAAAARLGVTENILSAAAFGYSLGSCNNAASSAFATIYNGRKDLRSAATAAMMVKTLPVSCKWTASTKAAEYLNSVKDALAGAMAHNIYSFEELCAQTSWDSRVLFGYQDELIAKDTFCSRECELIQMQDNATGEPLTVQLYKNRGTLSVRVEYRSNMFSETLIRSLMRCYSTVLASLMRLDKSSELSKIQLVTDQEKEELLRIGSGQHLDIDPEATFVTMFREQAERTPQAKAVVDKDGSYSYAELDSLSDSLASELLAAGVRDEDFVAVMMPRVRMFVTAFIAAYKSGAAYVPMDYEYPQDRIAYMLEDSRAKVLLTTRAVYESKFPEGELKGVKVIFVEELSPKAAESVDRSRPSGLAYMIYTSGTTGRPKGVMIEHHSLVNQMSWAAHDFNYTPGVKIAEHASFSFDASIFDLMSTLAFGGELHILEDALRKDPDRLCRYLNEHEIYGMITSTQFGMLLLRCGGLKLNYLLVGGEKLSGKFKSQTRIINGYGPTEFTVASSYYVLDQDNIPDNIPIGKAVANTISAIVDAGGNLVPRGCSGELVLIGPQLARGYWNREDVTASRFVSCPFIPGEKMYRTGDLASWNEDGELIYQGRIDTQVKLRGFRIELGEIESVMLKFEGVKMAVVDVKTIGGMQHLCAYYSGDAPVDQKALRDFLASSLTSYMVPTAFEYLEKLPLTPNGKVDKKALPIPQIKAEEIVAPREGLETQIFEIVSESLGTKDFGATSDLISMGLTSLGAISLSMLLEKKLSVKIPSSLILESPTIRQWVEASELVEEESVPQAFPKREFYPLTDNQTGIYIDWEQHRGDLQYNVPALMHFTDVSAETVCEAVKAFLEAHPYLKTRFRNIDGKVCQTRRDEDQIKINSFELSEMPSEEFFRSKVRPFDLYGGPLCRFEVYSLGSECWLLSDIHHIIFDGGSEALFACGIADYCNGKKIEDEKFTAFDYSLWYEQWKEGKAFGKAEKYFDSLLEGVAAASLPCDGEGSGSGSGKICLEIEREAIRKCCRRCGATENAFFLTALTQVLHRFSREENLAILTVSGGRSLSALENTAGMFVQTLPVVSRVGAQSIEQSLQSMHRQVIDLLSRDKYPYTRIVERNQIKPNILLAYQGGVLKNGLTVGGKELEIKGLALDTAKLPLTVNITPGSETISIEFEFDRARFPEEGVKVFAQALVDFAGNLAAADITAPIGTVSCVSPQLSEELVRLGTGQTMPVEKDATFVTLFKRCSEAAPGAKAVVDSNGSITYAELDRRSDILAARLVEEGVGKDSFVALMMPRSREHPIAYVAVYKSGAAFVPVDYEYPADRIRYMLEDSGAKVLVTTREIYSRFEGGLGDVHLIFIDEIDFSVEAERIDNSRPDGLAYMIYTSGTTGRPKGVMLEHHSLLNMVSWMSELHSITAGTRVAEHASFSFDASIIDLMTTLSHGSELHILAEPLRKDPEKLYNYLKDNEIEGMTITTQLGVMMLRSYDLPLRYICLGGEKLSGKFDTRTVINNGYGPTEFTVCSSYYLIDSPKVPDNIPIGKPVPNTISAIVDPCGNLLPRGCEGELVLIGCQIARGYWNKADITQKRFVPCPFVPGEKMYHTGDLAKWNEDGDLLYAGRIDTQVKLRGFRIELGEIESLIARYEGVRLAAAVVKEIDGVQHLCAYFTASSNIDQTALKAYLSSKLTSYMVPDVLMQLDSMPATPNGKVDTKALPVPQLAEKTADEFEAPEGEVEENIAKAFSEALGISGPLSRNASFFLLGGTSLLVMKLIVALAEFGLKVEYGDVFKYPTPRTLAAFLDGLATGRAAAPAVEQPGAEVPALPTLGEDGFDYSAINSRLEANRIENIRSIASLDEHPLGDVLLLGSTGFLGIHILHQLLTESDCKIYCIVRPRQGITCTGRLRSYLMYYFDDTSADLFGKRLFVIEGDMTEDAVMGKLLELKVDTVINCAANVKHFAAGDEIGNINLHGTERLIEYCLKSGARLIHTSTHSISGQMDSGEAHTLLESELYIGQKLVTKYQTSKFLAERAILDAAGKGLNAKIMRLGNLMPRFSDGEFQINIENNGFMARMRAYYLIGCIASSHLHSVIELAPIDQTASAVLTLARTPDNFTVFHPFNNHNIYIDDIVAIMRNCGLKIEIVDDAVFSQRLELALKDEKLNPYVTTLLAYGSHNNYTINPPSLEFTVNVLNAMDWRWPITGVRYLSDAFEKMKALQYFEI